MREVAFGFLSCLGCRFFAPKRPIPPAPAGGGNAALVGLCTLDTETRWAVWHSLEDAVRRAGRCDSREPRLSQEPRCPSFETTTDGATRPYPDSCVYYRTAICPLPRG